MVKKILLVAVIGIVILSAVYSKYFQHYKKPKNEAAPVVYQEGDIIFQTSLSQQSKAIQLATKSKYSHLGIVTLRDGQFSVCEAVQPVKFTKLTEWIQRGDGHHFVLKRLIDHDEVLTKENLLKLRSAENSFRGKNYDAFFEWTDDKIYCSELVWKVYKKALGIELGELQELKSFDLDQPLVKAKLKERYKTKIPPSEKVISPVAIFNSDKLETVLEK